MKISVVIGLAICSWTIIKFLGKLREPLAKVLERVEKDDEMEEETTEMEEERKKMEEEDSQTWLDTKTSSDLLVVTTSKLSQHVKFRRGEWPEGWVEGAIRTYQPATWHEQTMSYYFEIKIKDNFKTDVCMGFTNENFKNDILPGWDFNTYGYHDDGQFWDDNHYVKVGVIQDLGVDFDLRYTRGDTVGAGVNYVTGEMFFTKNQKLVGLVPCNLKTTLYPTVGFCPTVWGLTPITNVEVNFKGPYNFEVSHYMLHSNLKTPKKWSLQPKLAFPPFFQ